MSDDLTPEEKQEWRVDRVTWRFSTYLDRLAMELEDEAMETLSPGGTRDEGVAKKAKAEMVRDLFRVIEDGSWSERRAPAAPQGSGKP